ncbi:ABC transporter ATP-binding protein [Acidianus sp. HS-5]|uniref:ATP-binding cassette domain-containing protein n=1 Tax=Acidianus sp. HS-5 TaxID=2886040 RepID=UPI001F24293C|nr:ABC transporter ATP-binding protein [Acidianus sp. HS-5]BDC18793.1 hypothetical protein HS5_16830 [Acidianus sp. HS-5]
MLQAINVSKKYHKEYVLKDVSLEVNLGERLGIIGLHDTGKTVLTRLLAGLERPSSGKILLDGNKLDRKKIAYVPQAPLFDPLLKAKEIMRYVGNESYLDLVNVDREKKVKDMSLGEKKRLALALCLPFSPDYLLIDDIGEDGEFFLNFIKGFKGGVIITYHNLRDVWETVDKVVILSKGKVTYKGDKEGLRFKVIRTRQLSITLNQYVIKEGEYMEVFERINDNSVEDELKRLGVNYDVEEVPPDEVFLRFYA